MSLQTLNTRQLATCLAALRYWQREGWRSSGHEIAIANNGGDIEPLKEAEIDDLCEAMNFAETPVGPRHKYVCRTCGGSNVKVDAWATWNAETQRFELASMFDAAFCDDCDGECKLVTKEIAP
jgi:hypothetical protein